MTTEEPPSNRLIALATVGFLVMVVAFFAAPWYDQHKGRQYWKRRDPTEFDFGPQTDRQICADKFHHDSTGFRPRVLEQFLFALSPEERLRPCMEERGWEWQGD
jgi:hypothetical protein